MSDPTEMELRVARALFDNETRGNLGTFAQEITSTDLAQFWVEQARVAIRAMPPPTEAMCRAGAAVMWECGDLVGLPQAARVFKAMIDAASPVGSGGDNRT